jgi:thiol-disulfide isomerase/thioredoxin
MKKLAIVAFGLFLSLQYIMAQGIQFSEGSWADIQKKAKSENKYVFVDAYAVWCGPCKWMAKNIFTEKSVGDVFNKSFVSYKFDMEKGEGPDFSQKYNVHFYPTYLFFNPNGELVHISGGAKEAKDFVTDAENALNPEKQLFSLKKQFESGKKDADFLANYLEALEGAGMTKEASEPLNLYLSSQKEVDLVSEKTFNILCNLTNNVRDKGFQTLTKYTAEYSKLKGEKTVNEAIENIILNSYETAGRQSDAVFKKETDKIVSNTSLSKEMKDEMTLYGDVLYAQYTNDFNTYCSQVDKLVEKYSAKYANYNFLNNIAWYMYENTDDKTKLKKAESYAKRSVNAQKEFFNLDTYAHILFKLGKNKEAKTAIEEAIQLGEAKKQDVSESKSLLEQINKQIK